MHTALLASCTTFFAYVSVSKCFKELFSYCHAQRLWAKADAKVHTKNRTRKYLQRKIRNLTKI